MSLSETFLISPLAVPNCQLWLDAADSTTITLSGSNVSQWNDKSGNARHFLQGTAGNRPSFGTYLSYPSILFTGTASQFLSNNYIQTGNGGRHTYLVFADVSTTANIYGNPVMFFMADGNASQGGDWRAAFDGANQYLSIDVSAGAKTMRTSPNVTSMRTQRTLGLWGMATGAKVSNSYVYGNGTQFTTQVLAFSQDPNINITNSPPTRIGGGQTGYATFVLYELLYYNTELSTSERQKVEGYLAWKWGLVGNLPATHPYKNSRPLDNIPLPPSLLVPTRPLRNVFIFNPTVISNCALWLDAADSSTFSFSGSTVTQWADKSGNGRNATGSGTPRLVQNMQNRLPAIYFDGASYFTGSLTNTTAQHSFLSVFRFNTGAPQYARLASFGQNGQFDYNNNAYYNLSYNTGTLAITRSPTETQVTLASPALDAFHQASILFTGQNGLYYTDGGTNTNSATWTAAFNFNQYRLGSDQIPFVPQELQGYIAEVIVYSSALSQADRQRLEGYLAWKWGLETNLPITHPFRTNPPDLPASAPRGIAQLKSAFFNPRSISGCQFWLDVADAANRTVVGTTVSQLNDKSGNNYNATQTTVASRPTLSTSRLIQFANNTYFDFSQSAINNTTRYSLFLVFHPIASLNWILQKQYNGVGSYNMLSMTNYWQNNTGITNYLYWAPHANTGVLNAGAAMTLNTLQIVDILFDGTTLSFYRNGSLLNTVTSGGTLTIVNQTSATNCTIGSWRPDGGIANSGVTNFLLGELIYHNVAFSTGQRQAMEGYLAWKWGLVSGLPSTHPYKLFPPSP